MKANHKSPEVLENDNRNKNSFARQNNLNKKEIASQQSVPLVVNEKIETVTHEETPEINIQDEYKNQAGENIPTNKNKNQEKPANSSSDIFQNESPNPAEEPSDKTGADSEA